MVPGTGIEPASRIRAADFLHTTAFAASSAVRALDYAFTVALRAVGAPRLVSTPSRISGLGSGSAWPADFSAGVSLPRI